MLKGPALKSSGLHISVFQGGPDRGAFNMFENLFKKCSKIRKKVKTYKFKNYIDFNVDLIMFLILKNIGPRIEDGVLLASALAKFFYEYGLVFHPHMKWSILILHSEL